MRVIIHTLQFGNIVVFCKAYFIKSGGYMASEQFKNIQAINYWERSPLTLGFIRAHYVTQALECLDNHLLKVLIGQRRSGKSYILKQIISHLLSQGIANQNILYLNFELHALQFIQEAETLAEIIKLYYTTLKPQGKVYLFFDEIQEVNEWETVINSYLADDRFDVEIFLTGSNAHLLSTELSTYVTGRYIEMSVYPFSFSEYANYKKLDISKTSLVEYLESSGIPELFHLKDDKQKTSYLMSLKDSIVMNDVVKRFNIKNPKLLLLILDFLIDNIGHLFSFNAVVKKLKACGVSLNAVTVGNYIHYLEMTYLIHGVSRYDLRGKRILEGERKYYINDLAFSNYFQSAFDNGVNRKLENHVYLALLQAGYKIHVGNIYNLEIDFVAEKNKQIIYIQVTYLLLSEEVIAREYGNLEKISDHWPKWVVSLDDLKFPPKNGIQHIHAWELQEYLK